MRILIVLTYYRPYISGVTIYAERLASALAKRGHQVTVLTSRYDKKLALEEVHDNLRIIRVPVLFRISKGVIMPKFGMIANKLVIENDVLQLHLPQFDAAGVALRGRLLRKPTIITYHCDLKMPPGLLSWLANQVIRVMNNLAALFTHRIVTYTQDYAENSAYLHRYIGKLKVILPPVVLSGLTDNNKLTYEFNPLKRSPVIGMAARFASEKGVEILLDALPRIFEKYPDSMVQFAGAYEKIIGEEAYFNRLYPRIKEYEKKGQWIFLGVLEPEQIPSFYRNIDILVLPSLNSTEAFGLVQIEAMMNAKPCIASDLPGVRQPVLMHKGGRIIPTGNSEALANAVIDVLAHDEKLSESDIIAITRQYLPDTIAEEYEKLFNEISRKLNGQNLL